MAGWVSSGTIRQRRGSKTVGGGPDGTCAHEVVPQACRAEFPLLVEVEAPELSDPEHLIKSAQHALDDANDFSAHHLRLRLASPKLTDSTGNNAEENVAATLKLLPGPARSSHSYVPQMIV